MTMENTTSYENPYKSNLGGRIVSFPFYKRLFKRAMDFTLVLMSLPIIVPIIAIAAGLVMLDGGRPFFVQHRVGKHGRNFRMLKLRTMVVDAEAKLTTYLNENEDARKEWELNQKLLNDPRITRVGRILRKTSLDELPQLFNVLRGDMSLVGPRPMLSSQQELYPGTAYYQLVPGLTGPWQVSERHQSEFAARSKYDTQYLETISLRTDLSLLARTVRVVVNGSGV